MRVNILPESASLEEEVQPKQTSPKEDPNTRLEGPSSLRERGWYWGGEVATTKKKRVRTEPRAKRSKRSGNYV